MFVFFFLSLCKERRLNIEQFFFQIRIMAKSQKQVQNIIPVQYKMLKQQHQIKEDVHWTQGKFREITQQRTPVTWRWCMKMNWYFRKLLGFFSFFICSCSDSTHYRWKVFINPPSPQVGPEGANHNDKTVVINPPGWT